jgi:hypothetical protein
VRRQIDGPQNLKPALLQRLHVVAEREPVEPGPDVLLVEGDSRSPAGGTSARS